MTCRIVFPLARNSGASPRMVGAALALALGLSAASGHARAQVEAPHAPSDCIGPHGDTWITVTVDGVRNANGQIAATLYADEASRFLVRHGSLYVARTPAVAGATKFCLYVPKPGIYAIAIYHDEDNSGTINRAGVFGIPTEGFGFSNNPVTIASLPAFRSVRLAIPRSNLSTTSHLKYP